MLPADPSIDPGAKRKVSINRVPRRTRTYTRTPCTTVSSACIYRIYRVRWPPASDRNEIWQYDQKFDPVRPNPTIEINSFCKNVRKLVPFGRGQFRVRWPDVVSIFTCVYFQLFSVVYRTYLTVLRTCIYFYKYVSLLPDI